MNPQLDLSLLSDDQIQQLLKMHNINFSMNDLNQAASNSINGQINDQIGAVQGQFNDRYNALQQGVNNMQSAPGYMGSSTTGYMKQPGQFDMDRFGGAPTPGSAQYNMTPLQRANQMGITYNNQNGPGLSEAQMASDPNYHKVDSYMSNTDLANLAKQYGASFLQPGMLQSNYAQNGAILSPLHTKQGIGDYLDTISNGQFRIDHPELYSKQGPIPPFYGDPSQFAGNVQFNQANIPTPSSNVKVASSQNTSSSNSLSNWAQGLTSLPAPSGPMGQMASPQQNFDWYQKNVQKDADFWHKKLGLDPNVEATYFSGV